MGKQNKQDKQDKPVTIVERWMEDDAEEMFGMRKPKEEPDGEGAANSDREADRSGT